MSWNKKEMLLCEKFHIHQKPPALFRPAVTSEFVEMLICSL